MSQRETIEIPEFSQISPDVFTFNVYGRTLEDGSPWALRCIIFGLPAVLLVAPLIATIFGAQMHWGPYFASVAFGCFWVTVMLAFTSCEVDCDIDVATRQLRQRIVVFGKLIRTRRFQVQDGDRIGLGRLGFPRRFEHTIYCYRKRIRWRFTAFDCAAGEPRQELLIFVQAIADMLDVESCGYDPPHRVIWWL